MTVKVARARVSVQTKSLARSGKRPCRLGFTCELNIAIFMRFTRLSHLLASAESKLAILILTYVIMLAYSAAIKVLPSRISIHTLSGCVLEGYGRVINGGKTVPLELCIERGIIIVVHVTYLI